METFWFVSLAVMLSVYVILDGFDLGAGIIHYGAAKTPDERRLILRAIGPVWDGNEVWLVASGSTLFFSFPALYAASFSGLYLALMIVLWLLILRGVGIEFRRHLQHPLWHAFWDAVFAGSSVLLAIAFGAALGNVIRGVPLDADKYFFEPLWTDFLPQGHTGILDWYTVLTGVVALVTLAAHGAHYVATKTSGAVQERARRIALRAGWSLIVLTLVSLVATLAVRPQMLENYKASACGAVFPVAVAAGLAGMLYSVSKGRDAVAFVCSAVYIAGMLGGAAFGLYPNVLPATTDPAYSLTIYNAAAAPYGLRVGVIWWTIAMALADV